MKQFVRPNFKVIRESATKNHGKFLIDHLERGFGHTLGNSLRRTLLAATPGAAIYGVDIKGASHEFATIKGVVENVVKINLNLKGVILKIDSNTFKEEESVTLRISATEGNVTASMILVPSGVEIINGDHHIATVTKGGKLEITLYAHNSRGYKSFDDNKKLVPSIGVIPIDSNCSPIVNVKFHVEPTKVGKSADLEQLTFEVTTNGSISPVQAIALAAKVLTAHLDYFVELSDNIRSIEVISTNEVTEADELDRPIEELDLTVRSYNCLKRAGILTIGDLISRTESEIKATRNLGNKSLLEIEAKIAALGLTFRRE